MKRGLRTRHVDLSKSVLEFRKFPFAKKPQGAHAEREYWGDVGGRCEEGRGSEDGAIAAKSCCKVDFLG